MGINDLAFELRKRMTLKGMKQKNLALSAGLKETYVHDILMKKSKHPDVFKVGCIAQVLGCSIDDLVGSSFRKHPEQHIPHDISDRDEETLLTLWRTLSPYQKQSFLSFLRSIRSPQCPQHPQNSP